MLNEAASQGRMARIEDSYAIVDRVIARFSKMSQDEAQARFRRSGIINERNELTELYGGTGGQPAESEMLDYVKLGYATSPDGERFEVHFYGSREKAAVLLGPIDERRFERPPVAFRQRVNTAKDALELFMERFSTEVWQDIDLISLDSSSELTSTSST